jgi:hypothetical protein
MVRASAFSLYGPASNPRMSGTDQVYGVNMSRFLAAQDQPDQLVLSLYGQLAAVMTPNTFVAGEAASVAPLDGLRFAPCTFAERDGERLVPRDVATRIVQDTASGLGLAFATPVVGSARGGSR